MWRNTEKTTRGHINGQTIALPASRFAVQKCKSNVTVMIIWYQCNTWYFKETRSYLRPPFFRSERHAPSIQLRSSLCTRFTSCLDYGKRWSHSDYRHFLPSPFTAMPGMAAVFTQARSCKVQIPHPHGTCVEGRKGQGFLGEYVLTNRQRKIYSVGRNMRRLCNRIKSIVR